jgi:nucleotide-binding universal stress UspA family protein
MREILNARGTVVLEDFAQAARRERIAAETVLDMGVVPNQLCERAKAADLLMIGHRGVNERFSTGLLGSTTESVARKSPRPMLVSPIRFREVTRALAWFAEGFDTADLKDAKALLDELGR